MTVWRIIQSEQAAQKQSSEAMEAVEAKQRSHPDLDQATLDDAMVSVWRQALVEGLRRVTLGTQTYSVRRTAKRALAQVDFEVDGEPIRGLEQNPQTNSRWAQMARKGAKVMQFLRGGRYIAVVVDGKILTYGKGGEGAKDHEKRSVK